MPEPANTPLLSWASERCLRITLGSDASVETHRRVRGAYGALRAAATDGSLRGVRDIIPAYATVMVVFSPTAIDALGAAEAEKSVADLLKQERGETAESHGRLVEISVCYGGEFGPDLETVAAMHGLMPRHVIEIHSGAEYAVQFLGFAAGFAYLGGLPPELATERLEQPRVCVPAGSVGIAGQQTGVYPRATPGGWRLIGRTPVEMFDPAREPAALLAIGDRVRFVPVTAERFEEMTASAQRERVLTGNDSGTRAAGGDARPGPPARLLRVIDAGMFSTVQDLGREGFGAMGVAPSGAADTLSLRVGNRLVGNADGAAGIEMTMRGGAFAFQERMTFALTGAEGAFTLERRGSTRPVPMWQACEAEAGDVVRVGAIRNGVRVYLCIAGGVKVPSVLTSMATDLASGYGGHFGRALRAGDEIEVGSMSGEAAVTGRVLDAAAVEQIGKLLRPKLLRVADGAQVGEFSLDEREWFHQSVFVVSDQSNRMGLRLDLPPRGNAEQAEAPERPRGRMLSEAMPDGAVQMPPNGKPIMLLADRPTTGGYPVIACVISADLAAAGQLSPRDMVRFERMSFEEAREAKREQEGLLDRLLAEVRQV